MPQNSSKIQRINLRLTDAAAKDLKALSIRLKRTKTQATTLAYTIAKAVAEAEEEGHTVMVVNKEGAPIRKIQIPKLESVVVSLEEKES
jgi:hypothetical protein